MTYGFPSGPRTIPDFVIEPPGGIRGAEGVDGLALSSVEDIMNIGSRKECRVMGGELKS